MSLFRHKELDIPGLNTASLPDLIFTVLFFFMIVTHMRKEEVKVRYQVPAGTELQKLTKKSTVSYIYIGKPTKQMQTVAGTDTRMQLNDKYATVDDIAEYVRAERQRMSPEDRNKMTVSIKADRGTRMGIITDVKQALRHSNALNINYSATYKENN